MNNIPMPVITGVTDAEKIQNIISYLSQLFTELDRVLSSIGFQNLSQELSESIRKGITEHQDLSAYATNAFVKKHFEESIAPYATESWVRENFVYDSTFSDLKYRFDELSGTVSSHSTKIEKMYEEIYGPEYFDNSILKRLEIIESQLNI